MKKKYIRPELHKHGSIETMTQVLGEDQVKDSLYFNGNLVGTSDDSRDVHCNPEGCSG